MEMGLIPDSYTMSQTSFHSSSDTLSDLIPWIYLSLALYNHKGFEGFPGGSVVNNLLAMQEIWVQPLGQEDPLEEEMATHSTILAWRISWTEETGRLQSMGSQKSQIGLSD